MTDRALIITGVTLLTAGILAQRANRKKETQITHTSENMQTDTSVPRGYRNNNPLNIDYNPANKWQGEIVPSTDSRFAQFQTMAYGYRASMVLIRNYVNKYGCDTLAKIINKWAPVSENNTSKYIQSVCNITGFNPNTYINPYSETQMTNLMYAMSIVENGRKVMPDTQAINEGWQLYIS